MQAGWEYVFPSRLMLGIEADFSFPNYEEASKVLSYRATPPAMPARSTNSWRRLRGRLGYDIGAWTPYLTGGIAWMSTRYSRIDLTTGNEDANPSNIRLGYTVGAGIDYRLDSRWSARAEYLYTNFNLSGFAFGSSPSRYDTQYDLHRVRLGLNYRFGEVEEKKTKRDDRGPGSFEVRGQTVFVYQGYPPIRRAVRRRSTACRPSARAARPGRCRASSACGCGRAASSTTIPNCCRATASR